MSVVCTGSILTGERGLRGSVGQVRLLRFPEAQRSLAAAAATAAAAVSIWMRRKLRLILAWYLRLIRMHLFAARLRFHVLVCKNNRRRKKKTGIKEKVLEQLIGMHVCARI